MKIVTCSKVCKECGFVKGGTKDTLYKDIDHIIEEGIVFPCHMYLRDNTGSENTGTETLQEIQVCRGYVAYMRKNKPEVLAKHPIWLQLFNEITSEDIDRLLTYEELEANHKDLRDGVYLNN